MKKSIIYVISALFLFGTLLSGCKAVKNSNKTQRGAAIGVVAGSVLGAVLGNNIGGGGNGALGAVLGGVIGGAAGGIIGNRMDKQARRISEAIPGAKVERVGEGIKLVLGENSVRFDTNKSTLTTTAKSNLDKLVKVFTEYPDTDIKIYGYTDSAGADDYNMNLSQARAETVKTYLSAKGLSSTRFMTVGLGEMQPVATNDTPAGKSENRRVEFAITANDKMVNDAQTESGK